MAPVTSRCASCHTDAPGWAFHVLQHADMCRLGAPARCQGAAAPHISNWQECAFLGGLQGTSRMWRWCGGTRCASTWRQGPPTTACACGTWPPGSASASFSATAPRCERPCMRPAAACSPMTSEAKSTSDVWQCVIRTRLRHSGRLGGKALHHLKSLRHLSFLSDLPTRYHLLCLALADHGARLHAGRQDAGSWQRGWCRGGVGCAGRQAPGLGAAALGRSVGAGRLARRRQPAGFG